MIDKITVVEYLDGIVHGMVVWYTVNPEQNNMEKKKVDSQSKPHM